MNEMKNAIMITTVLTLCALTVQASGKRRHRGGHQRVPAAKRGLHPPHLPLLVPRMRECEIHRPARAGRVPGFRRTEGRRGDETRNHLDRGRRLAVVEPVGDRSSSVRRRQDNSWRSSGQIERDASQDVRKNRDSPKERNEDKRYASVIRQ